MGILIKNQISDILQRYVRSWVMFTDSNILRSNGGPIVGITDSCAIAWSSPKVPKTPQEKICISWTPTFCDSLNTARISTMTAIPAQTYFIMSDNN